MTPWSKPRKDKRGRLVCVCGGYHFPHRKGSGACEYSRTGSYHMALCQGATEQEARALLPKGVTL